MKKAYITVGISASGKTTWAHEFQKDSNANGETFVIISRDDVRWSMMKSKGITPSWANWKWKWEDEVTAIVNGYIREASVSSEIDGIIIADTNLDSDRLSSLKTELSALGFDTIVKVFDVEFDEAVRRDAARANGVGYSVIQRQYQKFISNYKDKQSQDKSKPGAIIVDIDGTMALMNGKRGPFEWHNVGLDDRNELVVSMVYGLACTGKHVIFTSGRDSVCRDLTLNWIDEYTPFRRCEEGITFTLLMRNAGDQRKDTIVKKEIYEQYINGNYNVVGVIDDRPSVCRMWRDNGLNVIQVGNPYIEF